MCGVKVCAQTAQLKLIDSLSNAIEIAYIKIYCKEGSVERKFYTITNGFAKIPASYSCNSLKIEINSPGFKDYHKIIALKQLVNDTLTIILSPVNSITLQPVVVTAKIPPIIIKNDTTIYKTKSFIDGTEQKLTDILEKLPGIEVNKNNGSIKFKGKPIETILLEGDNLFGSNYTLGSKNISANIVTEVQAIENYSDNYVLKGLEADEKVALNIKLAKTKLKVSGNTEIGFGKLFNKKSNAYDLNSNFLGVGNTHKFFSTFAFNNIGLNKSPSDYFGNNQSIEQLKEKKYYAQKFIHDQNTVAIDNMNYSNINSQNFNSHNSLIKLSPRITFSGGVYFIKDKISNEINFNNEFYLINDTIKTFDNISKVKSPKSQKIDLNLRYAISKKSLLEANFTKLTDEIILSTSNKSNFIQNFQTGLDTKDKFKKFIVSLTQRLSNSTALQFEIRKTLSKSAQAYNVSPSVLNRYVYLYDNQLSDFERNYNHISATIFGIGKRIKYNIFLKALYDDNFYFSSIINKINRIDTVSRINKINYLKESIITGANLNIGLGKLKVLSSFLFSKLDQKMVDLKSIKKLNDSRYLFEPTLKFRYLLSNISSVSFNYNSSFKNLNDQFLFPEIVIQNYRNIINNVPDLQLITTNTFALNYGRTDIFNQLDNGLGITYQTNNRDFLPTYNISDSLIYSTFEINSIINRSLDIHAYFSKYIPDLKSTLKITLNNTTSFYNNFLDTSVLRSNIFNTTNLSLFCKTAFTGKLNFEADNSFTVVKGKQVSEHAIVNYSYSFSSKIILIPSKSIKMFVAGDFFLPNIAHGKGNLFLNYNFSFKPSKSIIGIRLIANNLLNNLTFRQYQVSDFSLMANTISTLPRNILISLSLQF